MKAEPRLSPKTESVHPRKVDLVEVTPVKIVVNHYSIEADLAIPQNAIGLVIFAHGSGSSRFSPRNQYVARELRKHQLATLLVDLLTPEEDLDYHNRFDIDLLAERLTIATDWAVHDPRTERLNIGYFGASTGAAAAIMSASGAEDIVNAVVSRGGRVDLANGWFAKLKVPTLLIVGEHDPGVFQANTDTFLKLKCHKELTVIPGASHLFEEPGTLERVAELAIVWFREHLGKSVISKNSGKRME